MSAVAVTIQALLADTAIVAEAGNRVWPVVASQLSPSPSIVVHRISESDELLMRGPAEFPESRISVECRGGTFTVADALGELVVQALQNLHLTSVLGQQVSFTRQGTDVSGFADDSKIHTRTMDFYVRRR